VIYWTSEALLRLKGAAVSYLHFIALWKQVQQEELELCGVDLLSFPLLLLVRENTANVTVTCILS
jgi:hypothetical protein